MENSLRLLQKRFDPCFFFAFRVRFLNLIPVAGLTFSVEKHSVLAPPTNPAGGHEEVAKR